jgi:hypothetical protein
MQKNAKKYDCNICAFVSSNKCNYDKHLLTAKHRNLTASNIKNADKLTCGICCKKYNSRAGLWCHTKKCGKQIDDDESYSINTNARLIMEIIKENKDFKELMKDQSDQHHKQLLELQKENSTLINKMVEITQNQLSLPTTINNNNSNNTVNNNQKFNLNFFLNETCKDAMSIQEFIENVRINFEDLLTIGNEGFVSGVSDILIKQLRDLEINKRPIHCTDAKRETIYLKEEAAWNKDDKEKTKLKQLIEKIEYKNVAALHTWCNENPDAKVNNTPNNLLKDKIFYETLQGDDRSREKIIKIVSKEVILEKEK